MNTLRVDDLQAFFNDRQRNGNLKGKGGLSPKTLLNMRNIAPRVHAGDSEQAGIRQSGRGRPNPQTGQDGNARTEQGGAGQAHNGGKARAGTRRLRNHLRPVHGTAPWRTVRTALEKRPP